MRNIQVDAWLHTIFSRHVASHWIVGVCSVMRCKGERSVEGGAANWRNNNVSRILLLYTHMHTATRHLAQCTTDPLSLAWRPLPSMQLRKWSRRRPCTAYCSLRPRLVWRMGEHSRSTSKLRKKPNDKYRSANRKGEWFALCSPFPFWTIA